MNLSSFTWLNDMIGSTGQKDSVLHWPPRSTDFSAYDFFLWGFIKDSAYVPSLPATMFELLNRITTAVEKVAEGMLASVKTLYLWYYIY